MTAHDRFLDPPRLILLGAAMLLGSCGGGGSAPALAPAPAPAPAPPPLLTLDVSKVLVTDMVAAAVVKHTQELSSLGIAPVSTQCFRSIQKFAGQPATMFAYEVKEADASKAASLGFAVSVTRADFSAVSVPCIDTVPPAPPPLQSASERLADQVKLTGTQGVELAAANLQCTSAADCTAADIQVVYRQCGASWVALSRLSVFFDATRDAATRNFNARVAYAAETHPLPVPCAAPTPVSGQTYCEKAQCGVYR
ncbi:hypothetical protein GHT07_04950 [Caenimonas koreensis DSM 17982]|uniref:Lipoprotein n=1 Tax=Caenimonas koreensis DSM 17982 TaxID=1121255 RepID=A0A844B0G9_9BURK|nr:hypothetical protein [Caenimonas koreensis]MRD46613.1 hypothetical protein [Caenimonas koreensis DSM 17982]